MFVAVNRLPSLTSQPLNMTFESSDHPTLTPKQLATFLCSINLKFSQPIAMNIDEYLSKQICSGTTQVMNI